LTVRLIAINIDLRLSTAVGVTFSACIVGDDALHRPVLFTLATSSQGVLHEFTVPLTLGPSFSVRPENEAKDALKSTYGSLDNHSLMPTHSQYDKHKRILELLTSSTCKNTFHSLRQYLGCDSFFDYASHALLYFRLYCSFANQFFSRFAIHILLTRISQNTNFEFN